MTPLQLPLTAHTVPMRHVQGSEPVCVPADALCVLAPGHDAARDHVVRDDAPRGRAWVAGDVPEGAVVWVQDGHRWRAMVRVVDSLLARALLIRGRA